MFVIGLALGAAIGAFTAWRRKGNLADILQYAASFGIAFGLVFLVLGLILARTSM
ncbi:hypothetical protein [Aliishimia ponticola]|uniref:hypothetical protein n=1 Tax=Aliishimia ponticola TaxID=2499833 RepID=UPI0014561887|nr:hypothetical protein [Aliishimia ponticola]